MRLSLAILLSLSFTGCIPMSMHRGSDLAKLDEFTIEKNKTTERELIERFGKPQSTMTNADGSRVLTWTEMRGEGQMNLAASLVPFAWTAAKTAEQKTQSRSLMVTVRDGVVADYRIADHQGQAAF